MYKIKIENTSGELHIKAPEELDVKNAKNEIIEHTPEMIHIRSTFPNGFVCEQIVTSGYVEVIANCPIVFNGLSGFSFDFSKIEK